MYIRDFISRDYPSFKPEDSIETAAEVAAEFGFSHIFIESGDAFQGAISRAFLEESPEGTLDSLSMHYERFAVLEDASILDCVPLFHNFDANVVAIISATEEYLGYLSVDDVLGEFSRFPMFSENGAVLTLETPKRNYSLTEISQIVETEHARVYGVFISSYTDEHVQITLKISSDNLSSIDESLERHGYQVVNKYYTDEKELMLKDRFGFFQKFLEF